MKYYFEKPAGLNTSCAGHYSVLFKCEHSESLYNCQRIDFVHNKLDIKFRLKFSFLPVNPVFSTTKIGISDVGIPFQQ